MMLHPAIAQQFAAERQRELLDHATRHRRACTEIWHIRRLASVLAALAGVLPASAAAVPAAFAGTNPIPDPAGYAGDPYIGIVGTGPIAPVPATTVHVISTGGMPGWQITLIAIGAALLAAVLAVLADRTRAAHHKTAPSAA